MAKVTMYKTTWCPFCTKAKALLRSQGVDDGDIEEVDIEQMDDGRGFLQKMFGRSSVPQIVIAGKHVGGCDDLFALHHAGSLAALLR